MIYGAIVDICHRKEEGWRPRIPEHIVCTQAYGNVGQVSSLVAFPKKIKDGVPV